MPTVHYPATLAELETKAVLERRRQVNLSPAQQQEPEMLGLALSGGGIRSATLNLGILQALARTNCLRLVDFLSTVSGGGYIGGFLGRYFTRFQPNTNATETVAGQLSDPTSWVVTWLRRQSQYISPMGRSDLLYNVGVYLRNTLTLHFVLGVLLLFFFTALNLLRYWLFPWLKSEMPAWLLVPREPADLPIGYLLNSAFPTFWDFFSPWFMLVELILLLFVIPLGLAYWLAAHGPTQRYSRTALPALLLIASALLLGGMTTPGRLSLAPLFALLPFLAAFVWTELAWRAARSRLQQPVYQGAGQTDLTGEIIVGNRLAYWIGGALWWTLLFAAFALMDTAGAYLYRQALPSRDFAGVLTRVAAVLLPLLPVLRGVAGLVNNSQARWPQGMVRQALQFLVLLTGFLVIVFFLGSVLSFLGHWAYDDGNDLWFGACVAALTFLLSFILSFSLAFINDSSMMAVYAARLARAYLGATNPTRQLSDQGQNIAEVIPGDDVSLRDYHPHQLGGPLHIINATVNHTTDFYSKKAYLNRERLGDILAIGPFGLTVGPNDHALWGAAPGQIIPQNVVPNQDQPFATTFPTEELTLQQWLAISGAAVGPGRGRETNVAMSLFLSLANLRTGYWWDSGRHLGGETTLWDKMREWIPRLFLPQFLLYYEFIGRFAGPWARYWYLSDGGFFENLGAYELIRRRVRWIVCCDAGQDGDYTFDDLGNFIRKARIDFRAEVRFLTNIELDALNLAPPLRAQLGELDDLRPDPETKRSRNHAALAYVYYDGINPAGSVFLYMKASLTGDEPADVENFARVNTQFPHDPTLNQYFNEPQWESYRMLGEHIGNRLLVADAEGRFWLSNVRPWAQ